MKSYSLVWLLIFLVGCDQKPATMSEYLQQVHHCANPTQYNVLVFLPQNSCSGCLSQITSFLNRQLIIPEHTGIVIAGYGRAEVTALKNALKQRKKPYLIDIKYQYLKYNLSDASTAFWMEQKMDGSLQTYPLDAPRLAVNLHLLQKALAEPL